MTWIVWTAISLALLVAAGAGLVAAGARHWARASEALFARLESTRRPLPITHYDVRELADLPAPVQRYFRAVLKDGQPIVTAVTMAHAGRFNLSLATENWKDFHSEQRVVTHAPGFVWNGHITMLPGLAVHVHDAYIGGSGILRPALLGLLPLAGASDDAELARGELMRYVAEAPWYPTALLPSQGVRWRAVDADSADAMFVDGAISVTMRVGFEPSGPIRLVRFETRGMSVSKTIVPTPWEGRWSDYEARDGMQVPTHAEVAWLTPQGRKAYYRGRLVAIAFGF